MFATPEEAARGEIPVAMARVLATGVSPAGDDAFVLLGTNEPPQLYPYLVHCCRGDDGWSEASGSNGNAWALTSDDGVGLGLGGLAVWDEVPPGVESVTVRLAGVDHEVAVHEGYFLFTAWDVPASVRETVEIMLPGAGDR